MEEVDLKGWVFLLVEVVRVMSREWPVEASGASFCVGCVCLVEVVETFIKLCGKVVCPLAGTGVRGWMGGTAGRLKWRLSETSGSEALSLEEAMCGHMRRLALKCLPNTKRSGSTPMTKC